MTGLGQRTSATLAVIRIILECYHVVELILDSICIILVFCCKFCAFRIILFYIASFEIFFNETYAITSLAFQVSKMSLTTYLAQLISNLKAKL